MAKDIYVNPGELSSELLKKADGYMDTARSKLRSFDSPPTYRGPDGYAALYSADIIAEVRRLISRIETVSNRLERYSSILNSAPEALVEIDQSSKNELTNAWERATYEDGILTKFFTNDLKVSGALSVSEKESEVDLLGATVKGSTSALFYEGKIKNSASWDLEKGTAGLKSSASIKAGLAQATGEASYGWASAAGKVEVGTASAECYAGINLISDGQFDPEIAVGAKASAELLSGEAELQLGSDDYNIHAKAEGAVGVAEAEVKAKVSEDGVELGAEVGAAVFSGELSGGVTIFGIKIDITAKGEALAVGAEASFTMESDEIELSGKLATVLGLGLKIKVSW